MLDLIFTEGRQYRWIWLTFTHASRETTDPDKHRKQPPSSSRRPARRLNASLLRTPARRGAQGTTKSHPDRSVGHDLHVDFAAVVRSSLEAGDTPDQVAQALIEVHRLLPISAIKALRSGGNMTSDEAKDVIKRNLPAEQWVSVEGLWAMIASNETGESGGPNA
jgi:hypothetical protein